MSGKDMFDDGQPQSGTAGFPRTAAVYPIEALGQTVDMLLLDANTGIRYAKNTFLIAQFPGQGNLATFRYNGWHC